MQSGTEANYRRLAAAALLKAVSDSRSGDPTIREDAADWLASVEAETWAECLDIRLDRLSRVPDNPSLTGKRALAALTRVGS